MSKDFIIFSRVFNIANQLLIRHSPFAPLGQVNEWTAKPSPFTIIHFFFLYDKQNNTCLFADMKFFFSCSTRHLNRSLLPLVSYRVKRSLPCIIRYLIFIRITLSVDLMLPIFWFYFVIFLLLSCWISSGNSLIWIFVTFVITIEVVSFWLGLFILVILIKDYLKCVIAMPQYKLLIYLLLYQINILILTRVIMEMTKMQATGDNQSQQLRWKRALNEKNNNNKKRKVKKREGKRFIFSPCKRLGEILKNPYKGIRLTSSGACWY